MRAIAMALALALAGCAAPQASYREAGGRIASMAQFDTARFADVWHIVAAYGPDAACGPLAETWVATGKDRFRVTGTRCGPRGARAFVADARVVGPGRLAMDGPGGRQEYWVLWVDADYRIAALGAPDGRIGRIIARAPSPRPDLLAAAREVLDFNGYDAARLKGL